MSRRVALESPRELGIAAPLGVGKSEELLNDNGSTTGGFPSSRCSLHPVPLLVLLMILVPVRKQLLKSSFIKVLSAQERSSALKLWRRICPLRVGPWRSWKDDFQQFFKGLPKSLALRFKQQYLGALQCPCLSSREAFQRAGRAVGSACRELTVSSGPNWDDRC